MSVKFHDLKSLLTWVRYISSWKSTTSKDWIRYGPLYLPTWDFASCKFWKKHSLKNKK